MPLFDTPMPHNARTSLTIARNLPRLFEADSASPHVCCKATSEQTSHIRIEKVLTATPDCFKAWQEILLQGLSDTKFILCGLIHCAQIHSTIAHFLLLIYFSLSQTLKQSAKREKTKKMQQSDVYYQLLSQHVSGIIMPIFRRSKTVLLHMEYRAGSAGCGW